jgi:hypothetical protein
MNPSNLDSFKREKKSFENPNPVNPMGPLGGLDSFGSPVVEDRDSKERIKNISL